MGKTMKHGKTLDGNNFERTMNNYGKPIGEKYEKTMGKLWENYGTYGPMLPAVRDPLPNFRHKRVPFTHKHVDSWHCFTNINIDQVHISLVFPIFR